MGFCSFVFPSAYVSFVLGATSFFPLVLTMILLSSLMFVILVFYLFILF